MLLRVIFVLVVSVASAVEAQSSNENNDNEEEQTTADQERPLCMDVMISCPVVVLPLPSRMGSDGSGIAAEVPGAMLDESIYDKSLMDFEDFSVGTGTMEAGTE